MSKQPETINVEHAFNPELRQAQEDMNQYLSAKPYMDVNGRLHDPETNAFLSKTDAEAFYSNPDAQEEVESFDDFYASLENLSLSELALLSAGSLHQGDKTFSGDLDYIIRNKIENTGSKTDLENRDGSARDKSEADNLYDRVMKLRDSKLEEMDTRKAENDERQKQLDDEYNEVVKAAVLSMEVNEESLIPTPPSLQEALENTTIKQAKLLNHAWEKQTGQYESPVDPAEVKEVVEPIEESSEEEILEPIVVDADEASDLPPIIVNDDDIIDTSRKDMTDGYGTPVGPGSLTGTPVDFATRPKSKETPEKKKSWKKKVAIGAIALAGLIGLGFAVNSANDDNNTDAPAAAADSGVDFTAAAASLETTTTTTTEAPVETVAIPVTEEEKAAAITATVESATPEQLATFSGLNAEAIVVSGDAMPSTNFAAAGSENLVDSYNAALAIYNPTVGEDFAYDPATTWFINSKGQAISPEQLEDFNSLVKQMTEKANQ